MAKVIIELSLHKDQKQIQITSYMPPPLSWSWIENLSLTKFSCFLVPGLINDTVGSLTHDTLDFILIHKLNFKS
jgi:ABC-type polysaccharide transport system permease subunit